MIITIIHQKKHQKIACARQYASLRKLLSHSRVTYQMSFHKFPVLPLEIQRQIWTITVHDIEPRIISVQVKQTPSKEPLPWVNWPPVTLESAAVCLTPVTPIPAVFHVCRESRLQAMTRYSRTLAMEPHCRYIWADVRFDHIFLAGDEFLAKSEEQQAVIFRTATLYTRHDDALRSFEDAAVDAIQDLNRIRITYES